MAKCRNTTTKMLGIRWTIENVSKIKRDSKVMGPDFYLAPECMIRISFKKGNDCSFVYLSNKLDNEIAIERTIALYDYNNKKLHEEEKNTYSLKKDKDVDVIGSAFKNNFQNLLNDVLVIDLYVRIKENVGKKLNHLACDTDPELKLKEAFKTMLENPVNSDVSLQVGDKRIPAHWLVLCSRSSYFKRMFDSGMRERVQKSITITDLSLGTIKKLLQFLYTANISLGDDLQELFDLYYAADKYEVMDLRILCACNIMDNVTADNAGAILQLAHRHNDKNLKMEVIDFIHSHSDAVFQTESWKKLEASDPTVTEIVSFFCLKKNNLWSIFGTIFCLCIFLVFVYVVIYVLYILYRWSAYLFWILTFLILFSLINVFIGKN